MTSNRFKFYSLFFLLPLLSYAFILDNDFLGDDYSRILFNTELNSFWDSITGKLGDRPLLMALMWVEKQFFDLNPIGFRIVNIFLHALVAYQLFQLMRELRQNEQDDWRIPFTICLIFAIHPLSGQSIYIIIQGGVLLSGLFGLMSLRYFFRWIKSNGRRDWWLSIITICIGILFKPNLSFIPVYYAVAFWVLKPNEWKAKIWKLWPHFLTLLIPVAFYMTLDKNVQQETLTAWKYFLTQCEVIFVYMKLMVFPVGLRYLYDFDVPKGLDYHHLLLLAHLVIIYGGYRLLKSKLQFLLLLGFYLAFLPESGFFPIMHVAFEHRTYFNLMFLALLVNELCLEQKFQLNRNGKAVSGFVLGAFLILNQARNFQIKPVANWMLHTLEYSSSQHGYNVNFSFNLLRINQPKILEPILKIFRKKFPGRPEYEGLDLAVKGALDPENMVEYCRKIGEITIQHKLKNIHRYDFLVYMILKLYKPEATRAELMVLETTLANQVTIINRLALFEKINDFYIKFSDELLRFSEENPDIVLEFWKYRIQAIQVKYYGRSYPGLRERVKAAYDKNQDNQFLIESLLLLSPKS